MTQFLLIAHIGATKARFGLREPSSNRLDEFLYKSRYPIGLFKNSTTMIEHFIQEARDSLEYRTDITDKINVAEIKPTNIKVCLALAGPVHNNTCDLTSWKLKFDGKLLKVKLRFKQVELINDFQAIAYGVTKLSELDFWTLQKGNRREDGLIAVIGVATGLGKSFLIQASDEKKLDAYATEGGHINFAPYSQFEFALFQYILCPLKDSSNKDSSKSEEKYKRSEDPPHPIGVIVAGTDLGEAFILKKKPDDTGAVSRSQEGSHADFAVRSLEEFELIEYIQRKDKLNRVSVERVVSVPGIVRIYQFLQENYSDSKRSEILQNFKTRLLKDQEFEKIKKIIGNIDDIPEIDSETARKIEEADNQAIEIADAALDIDKRDLLCLKTMAMFAEAYGSEVGNFALRVLPYEGLYVAGSIAPKILQKGSWLRELFLKELKNKGRMEEIIEKIPIYLVKNEQVGLIGAVH